MKINTTTISFNEASVKIQHSLMNKTIDYIPMEKVEELINTTQRYPDSIAIDHDLAMRYGMHIRNILLGEGKGYIIRNTEDQTIQAIILKPENESTIPLIERKVLNEEKGKIIQLLKTIYKQEAA